jgi:hypothetical protein
MRLTKRDTEDVQRSLTRSRCTEVILEPVGLAQEQGQAGQGSKRGQDAEGVR